MGLLGRTKQWINRGLAPLGMRLESLEAERAELARLRTLVASGQFDRPAYPVLPQFAACDPTPIVDAVRRFESRFDGSATRADGFRLDNDYYSSPDAEVLYAIVRMFAPARIVEIGSGNSTLLFRHAIADGGLVCRLSSIDPSPRREIAEQCDEVFRCRLEYLADDSLFRELRSNDILFVDSSHEVKAGNDVLTVFLRIMPSLRPGVVVHIHDVFLPYEYPKRWVVENRWTWGEQYLLQTLLQHSQDFDVLWCGHYLQRTRPRIFDGFRFWTGADAKSVWLRKRQTADGHPIGGRERI